MSDERRDHRQEVTDNLIAMLERGTAPWQKPWDPERAALQMPMNPTTGNAYRGGNAVHLLATAAARGYEDPRWTTYRQAQEQGWQVRKGEKGTAIEFWQFPRDKDGAGNESTDDKQHGAPIHRVYTVFNAQQMDGVPEWKADVRPEWQVVQSAENILDGSGSRILHDQRDRAFYTRATDEIHLPAKGAFPNEAAYYGTALHELVHWSGHESRLNRDTLVKSDGFGGAEYAKEELRAELGSLFLAAERGIPHDPEQHAAYVGSWIEVLRKDKNEIFRAAKDASKATEYLLAREIVRTETSEHTATFDTRTGGVDIVEKNTATEHRELYQPVDHTAPDALAPGKSSAEQILDGVVDGRAASLSQARAVVERELGEGARSYNAHTDSGDYKGPIIGVTDAHLVQRITPQAAVIHEANGPLAGLGADANKPVAIRYDNHLAHIAMLKPKSIVRDIAELER